MFHASSFVVHSFIPFLGKARSAYNSVQLHVHRQLLTWPTLHLVFVFFIFIYYHYILPSQLAPIGCRLRKERTNSFHSYSLVCWHIILCIIDSMLWSFQTTSHTHTHKHVGTQYCQEWLHLNQLTEYEDDDVDADGWHLTPMWLHVDVLLCYTNTLYDWLWWWRWLQPSCGRVLEVNSIFYGNKHKVCFLDDCDN